MSKVRSALFTSSSSLHFLSTSLQQLALQDSGVIPAARDSKYFGPTRALELVKETNREGVVLAGRGSIFSTAADQSVPERRKRQQIRSGEEAR